MDSSIDNPFPQTSSQSKSPLQFTIHLPHSSNPNSNPAKNPDYSQSLSFNAISVENHFLSAPIPKGKRRGRPRNPESSSNQVNSLPSLSNKSSLSNAGGSPGSFNPGQVYQLRMQNYSLRTHGSSSTSANFSKRSVHNMSDEIIVINKEATAEALIALSAGFPADSLTDEELDYGVVSDVGGIEQVNYILIRNHIITRWRENVRRWVTKEMFVDIIPKHCGVLLETSYNYLVEHGYINFGVAPGVKERILVEPSKGTVIVVGAGLAGLAAARQLMAFGFKVVVLEGRKRAGGRVYTMKLEAPPGSASKKVGFADLGGSVLTGTLGNPLGLLARQLSCTLHKVRNKCPLYRVDGTPVDPVLDRKVEDGFNDLLETVSKHRKMMGEVSQDISLGSALETFREPFNEEEMNLLNWHFANLEYANAGLLSRLSLAFWDQDDPYDMGGDHCFLPGGNGRLIQALVENVPIHYGKTVHTIRYGNDGVQVTAGEQVYKGDMVLCTVPLGVLKTGSINFIPELPQRKLDGIKRLGFGLLNKVVMLFPHAFWGTELDTFGHLTEDPSSRGEFFLFYSYATVAGGPILIGLVAGEAAYRFEAMHPTEALERVLRVLKGIYEPQGIHVPPPIQTVCTRWGGDTLSCGSYSNVAVGASGDDYDILAESVGDGRLFFAGEATSRRYPATMHGAFLSGFREAANMARYAGARALGLKIEKNLSKNAHNCATILADLFRAPDVEFGSFAVIFDRKKSDSMAILRVTIGGQRKKQDQQYSNKLLFEQLQSHFNQQRELHVYTMLSNQQANELREVRGGDEARLNYLQEKLGVKLVGRKGLGPSADAVIDSIKAQRSRGRQKASLSGESKSKVAPPKPKLIRKAKILRIGNKSSIQIPNTGSKVISAFTNAEESRRLGDHNALTCPSLDVGVRVSGINDDVTPPNPHSGNEFVNDTSGSTSQNLGQNFSATPLGSNIGFTDLSNNSSFAPSNSNDIRGSNPQNLTPASSNSAEITLSINNGLPLPSLDDHKELVGDIKNEVTYNIDTNDNSIALPNSEVAAGAFSTCESLVPSSSQISSFGPQNYAGDISDSLSNIAIQENIFEDIMNELLPTSVTDSSTWRFQGDF